MRAAYTDMEVNPIQVLVLLVFLYIAYRAYKALSACAHGGSGLICKTWQLGAKTWHTLF